MGVVSFPLSVPDGEGGVIRLKSQTCAVCHQPVSQHDININRADIQRIGGDSANGYEPFHLGCVGILVPLTPTAADADDDEWI